jgi:hypothetical protein
MNVILHGEGKEIRMHRTDTDQVLHRLTVPVKVFSKASNKWSQPITTDAELIYRYLYQLGDYHHYELSHVTSKQS